MPRRATIASAVGLALVLAAIAAAAWPRSADGRLASAYDRLAQAPVPVLVVYTPSFDPSTASLEREGYTLSVADAESGPLTLRGTRLLSPPPGQASESVAVRGTAAEVHRIQQPGSEITEVTWRDGSTAYTLSVPGAPDHATLERVAQRVVTLDEARRAALGYALDTPLLYLLYLPLFVGFVLWASFSLLRETRLAAPSPHAPA